MTHVGKSRLVKAIFTKIHKISDALQFWCKHHDCTMYEKCFYFLLKSSSSGKMVFLRKLKLIYPGTPSITTIIHTHLFNFIQKIFSPTPFKKEDRDYAFCMTDYQGETIRLLPFYTTDLLFTELLS